MHSFLFIQGTWLGEGLLCLSASDQPLPFSTRWEVRKELGGVIEAIQTVEIEGADYALKNVFRISQITSNRFTIELSNLFIENVKGKGLWDEEIIAWEFQQSADFQGVETYQRASGEKYRFHAEYISSDSFSSVVEGVIQRTG